MVRHQEGQRFLVTELLRLACLLVVCDASQAFIQSGQLRAEQVDSALAALDGLGSRESSVGGLQGELVVFHDYLFHDYLGKGPQWLAEWGFFDRNMWRYDLRGWSEERILIASANLYQSPLGRPWRQYDDVTGLALFREGIELLEQPFYAVHERFSRWEERMEARSWKAPVTRLLLPVWDDVGRMFASREASVVCARTALAVERYRLTHGGYPATLDALVPDILPQVPLDPLDGEPLRYVNDGKRVAVYSVGENLQDDGGSEEEVGSPHHPKDIAFSLRPARVEAGGEAP